MRKKQFILFVIVIFSIITSSTASAADIILSGSDSYTAQDGDVLTGSTSGTVTIANNAKITLSDVTITGGIVCAGTAEITLVGMNSVTGASQKAGIQVGGLGTTLTIKGNGSLTANGGNQSAGIGLSRAWSDNATGGDILIEGGNITANGSVNGQWGAGIGTGVIYGNGSAKTARIGNITIKGGSVKATGGSEANGIGTGYTYGGCTNTIGTVTIYVGIDKVDASSIRDFGSVVYKHDETDVTANKSDYFTITEDGNRRVIEPKDDTDYTITIANGIEHGTLTGAATAKYTEKVTITATPALGYRFSRLVVKDAQNNDVASTGNSFFMPKSNVTVSAVFEQGTHGTTEFAWGYYLGSYVTEATIYDGVTTVELQQGKKYFIGKDYQEGPEPGKGFYENEFRPDEDPYARGRDIPYSGGTGSFMVGGYGEFTLNGDAGYYDITMTDVGNGKWNVSILKTAGQMDVVPDQTYTGSAITPEPTVIAGSLNLTKGTDYVYSYENNENVGTAKVIASFLGTYAWLGNVEKEFTIVKATPTVNAPTAVENLIHNGSAQALVNAGSTDFGTLLYSLDGETYSEDIPTATSAGTHTVYYKVAGDNNHNDVFGSLDVTIAPKAVTNNDITITIQSQTWTGNELTPDIIVKDGETVLILGTDYTVSYSNNIDAAASTDSPAPTVTITGIGNYTGSVSKTFTIAPGTMSVSATDFTGTYDGKLHRIVVNAPEHATIVYGTSSGIYPLATNPTYTDAGTYTVYYRVNKNNYTPVEGSATVTITPRQLTAATLVTTNQTYDGTELTFVVEKVTAGTIENLTTADYDVTGNTATAVGNYTATVTGKGNFTGSVSVPYSILPENITADELFNVEIGGTDYDYSGTAIEPDVTVKNSSTLDDVDPSNYTVTYSNNINAGTATVTVTANSGSGYYGTETVTFKINKAPLTVKADNKVVNYGQPAPTYTATYTGFVNGETVANLDGTLAYNCSYVQNASGAGNYDIWPAGLTSNNYDITFDYGTLKVNKVAATVVAPPTANANLTYNGAAQALVSPGTAKGGTMQYKVGTTGTWSEDVPTATAAGTYAVYYKVVGDANHNDVAEAGPINATIAMAQLIVKAKDLTVEYGATPTFDVTYKGFVTGEDAAVLGGTLSYDCGYTPGASDMGIYDITPGGLTALNYDIVYSPGTLTVTVNTLTTPTIELSPAEFTYSGNACEPTVTVKDGETVISPEEYTVSYSNNIDAASSTAENAPTVTITDNLGGNYTVNGTQTFTIAQATNAFTSQPAITGWAVGGTPNEPTGAAVSFGTVVYKYGTSDSGPWETAENTTFIEGTWYVKGFVEATTNYTAAESDAVSFEVAEPAMALITPPTPVDATLTYSGSAQTLFNPGSATGGTLKYYVTTTNKKPTYKPSFGASIIKGTNAGTYYLWYYIDGGDTSTEINDVPVTKTIERAAPTYTAPTAKSGLVYDGLPQVLINAGSSSHGTMLYSLDNTNWMSNVSTITGTDATSYTVYYHLWADANHLDVPSTSFTVTIGKRDISKTGYADGKSVTVTTIDQTWTGNTISTGSVYTIVLDTDPSSAPYTLTADDHVVNVKKDGVSSEIKTEGHYTITVTGTGNFEGTVTRTFDVTKGIDESVSSITFDIPIQVEPQVGPLVPNITVYDEKEHTKLVKGVDYSVKYFESDAGHSYDKSTTEVADPSTLAQGKYWVTVTGLPPKYTGSVDKEFYVVNEYQAQAATATNPAIAFRVDAKNPGTPDNSPKGKVNVGAATGTAIDAASQTVAIPATVSVDVADKTFIFDVAGIESGAFDGCSQLHYIDATAMTDYAPAKLDRQGDDGPFKGLPKQALVFLGGDSYHGGENYVYKTGTDQYYCNTLKIYDDVNAKQTGFDNATAAQWGFMNPYEFTAEKVVNTRVLNAEANGKQQGYSTCLPYALPVTDAFKAYTLETSKDNVVGFTEVTGTLAPMTPYVLIPAAAGELLSATNATVAKTYDGSTGTYEAPASLTKTSTALSGQAQYTIKGTMQYLPGTTSMYIMQANNVWNQATASDWPGPCVLPMRVYIEASGAAPARLFSTFVKEIENGKWTMDNDEVYDLLGRKVKNPQRGSIYIVNGQKMRMK